MFTRMRFCSRFRRPRTAAPRRRSGELAEIRPSTSNTVTPATRRSWIVIAEFFSAIIAPARSTAEVNVVLQRATARHRMADVDVRTVRYQVAPTGCGLVAQTDGSPTCGNETSL